MLGALALTYLWVTTALRKEDLHMRSRPQTVSAAAIVLALFSVLNLVFPLFPIEGITAVALYLGIVLGAAAGIRRRRWFMVAEEGRRARRTPARCRHRRGRSDPLRQGAGSWAC